MTNFVLVDDDVLYRSELEKVVLFQADWQCVLSASSVEDFKQKVRPRTKIDYALLDVQLPDQLGLTLVPIIKKLHPKAKVIILTHVEERELLFQAFSLGADGYLLKDFSPFQLPQLIKVYKEGGALISPLMARHLVQYFSKSALDPQLLDSLTNKEAQILNLLGDGNSYEEIGEITGNSINTVRFHIKNAYKKLRVDNRVDAIRKLSVK